MRFFSVCHRIGIGKLLKAASSSQSAAPRLSSSDFCCAFIHTRFFLMLFSFSTIVEFNCRKKTKKGARSLRVVQKKKQKKKGKKRHVKKSDQKIDTKSSSLLTCARLCTLGEAAATAKDDDDDDATTRARGGVKKLRGGFEEETPAR